MIEYTVRVDAGGTKEWYLNGQLHREDGPAVECSNGSKSWWLNGQLHREDGPAVECSNGTKEWYLNGKLNREDGPAVECPNGTKLWYLNGKNLFEEEHKAATQPTVEMTVEDICKALGKNVKVVK
jgi:antitoxin component YwqK of YwqJK toxin-antitoxin module